MFYAYACMWHVKSTIQDNIDRGDRSQIVKVERMNILKGSHACNIACMHAYSEHAD